MRCLEEEIMALVYDLLLLRLEERLLWLLPVSVAVCIRQSRSQGLWALCLPSRKRCWEEEQMRMLMKGCGGCRSGLWVTWVGGGPQATMVGASEILVTNYRIGPLSSPWPDAGWPDLQYLQMLHQWVAGAVHPATPASTY